MLLTRLKIIGFPGFVFKKLSYIVFGIKITGDLNPANRGECRKAIRVGPTKLNQLIMEQNAQSNPLNGLNKQKLYAIIIAAVGIISCLLPWWHISFRGFGDFGGAGYSVNGLHKLGIVAFLGFIGAGIVPFVMGDKSKPFEGQEKLVTAACFAGAAAFALITLLANMRFLSFGIFIAIAAGVIGALFVWGIVKMPEKK